MSTLLKEISASEVNKVTKNGGAPKECALYAAQYPIAAAMCGSWAGSSSCSQMKFYANFLSKYCR